MPTRPPPGLAHQVLRVEVFHDVLDLLFVPLLVFVVLVHDPIDLAVYLLDLRLRLCLDVQCLVELRDPLVVPEILPLDAVPIDAVEVVTGGRCPLDGSVGLRIGSMYNRFSSLR